MRIPWDIRGHPADYNQWHALGNPGWSFADVLPNKPYTDLGTDYFGQLDQERIERHHTHRVEQLGYSVTPIPKALTWRIEQNNFGRNV